MMISQKLMAFVVDIYIELKRPYGAMEILGKLRFNIRIRFSSV